jgi:hypothetical protein
LRLYFFWRFIQLWQVVRQVLFSLPNTQTQNRKKLSMNKLNTNQRVELTNQNIDDSNCVIVWLCKRMRESMKNPYIRVICSQWEM